MPSRWFPFSFQEEPAQRNGNSRNGLALHHSADAPAEEAAPAAAAPAVLGHFTGFEQIYQGAAVKPAAIGYGILKVADMANSPHLGGMSPDARRAALMMALEAAGVEIEDLLQDAVVRQRALNDYEEAYSRKLKELEAKKAEDSSRFHTELERLTKELLSRIQTNTDEVAREQDSFQAWRKRKQQESQRISDAAAFCVPQGNPAANGNSLTAVLERATVARK